MLAEIAGGLSIASGLLSAFGAAEDAKATKKAIKTKRDADLEVLQADTDAALANIEVDTEAQAQVIESDARARIAALQYQADTEAQNVQLALIGSADARARGVLDEWAFRREASQVQGQQRAQLASSGVVLGDGSAAWLQEETIVATDLEGLAIRQNAGREAYSYEVEAYSARRRQGLADLEAASTATVATANIEGLRKVAKTRAEGIKKTSEVNAKAIRNVAESGLAGISPTRSAIISAAGSATTFATNWYAMNR